MDSIRFFDREDEVQPNAARIGQGGFELARAATSGLQVASTFIVGARVFRSLLRTVRKFESSSSMSFIDWVDSLAQSIVDRGEFAGLPVSLQTRIAMRLAYDAAE
jgi:hypothetical protein